MITPAYGMTATERVLPRLALDFTTASLDSRVAVARLLNTATRINSTGLVETVNANLPRFDFDPSTLVCRGLLIEETRTNAILFSEDFSNANWAKTGATVSANASAAPDGNTTADALVETATTGLHIAQQFFTFATATAYTVSVFVKPGLRTWVQIFLPTAAFGAAQGGYFNLSGAGSLGNATGTPTSRTITALPNGWYRCTVTATSTAAAGGNVGVAAASANGTNSYAGSNGSTALTLWGADLEVGGFATSYIANLATGTTTRNADVVSMTGSNFSSWWQAITGGLAVRARQRAITGTRPLAHISDGTADNIISLRGNVANPELYIKATTDQAQIDAGTLAANTSYGLVGAWNTNDCAAAIDGGAAVTDATATIPTVSQMLIGSDGANYLSGWVEKLSFWPQRITNSETSAFSK